MQSGQRWPQGKESDSSECCHPPSSSPLLPKDPPQRLQRPRPAAQPRHPPHPAALQATLCLRFPGRPPMSITLTRGCPIRQPKSPKPPRGAPAAQGACQVPTPPLHGAACPTAAPKARLPAGLAVPGRVPRPQAVPHRRCGPRGSGRTESSEAGAERPRRCPGSGLSPGKRVRAAGPAAVKELRAGPGRAGYPRPGESGGTARFTWQGRGRGRAAEGEAAGPFLASLFWRGNRGNRAGFGGQRRW